MKKHADQNNSQHASDERCKQQRRTRCYGLPIGKAFTSDQEFDAITAYFQTPCDTEGFNVLRHTRESRGTCN